MADECVIPHIAGEKSFISLNLKLKFAFTRSSLVVTRVQEAGIHSVCSARDEAAWLPQRCLTMFRAARRAPLAARR
ncbi:MAG: hypothetical protein ABJQ85_18315 [Rhizobiaceae bacterium]